MSVTPGELRRTVSIRGNSKTEAFRADEGVKASRFQDVSEASIYENRSHLQNIDPSPATPDRFTGLP